MLNLRQLNEGELAATESDTPQFARFSTPNIEVPSRFLGNKGEPLDHGQTERYIYEDGDRASVLGSTFSGDESTDDGDQFAADSDSHHFSTFSAPNFCVPSNCLGNIGEPLDHGQTAVRLSRQRGRPVQRVAIHRGREPYLRENKVAAGGPVRCAIGLLYRHVWRQRNAQHILFAVAY